MFGNLAVSLLVFIELSCVAMLAAILP